MAPDEERRRLQGGGAAGGLVHEAEALNRLQQVELSAGRPGGGPAGDRAAGGQRPDVPFRDDAFGLAEQQPRAGLAGGGVRRGQPVVEQPGRLDEAVEDVDDAGLGGARFRLGARMPLDEPARGPPDGGQPGTAEVRRQGEEVAGDLRVGIGQFAGGRVPPRRHRARGVAERPAEQPCFELLFQQPFMLLFEHVIRVVVFGKCRAVRCCVVSHAKVRFEVFAVPVQCGTGAFRRTNARAYAPHSSGVTADPEVHNGYRRGVQPRNFPG